MSLLWRGPTVPSRCARRMSSHLTRRRQQRHRPPRQRHRGARAAGAAAAGRTTTSAAGELPLFSFGLIADVQWMDTEVGYNYKRTVKRCYRGALDVSCSAASLSLPPTCLPACYVILRSALVNSGEMSFALRSAGARNGGRLVGGETGNAIVYCTAWRPHRRAEPPWPVAGSAGQGEKIDETKCSQFLLAHQYRPERLIVWVSFFSRRHWSTSLGHRARW
jgi:hypothetical protein